MTESRYRNEGITKQKAPLIFLIGVNNESVRGVVITGARARAAAAAAAAVLGREEAREHVKLS